MADLFLRLVNRAANFKAKRQQDHLPQPPTTAHENGAAVRHDKRKRTDSYDDDGDSASDDYDGHDKGDDDDEGDDDTEFANEMSDDDTSADKTPSAGISLYSRPPPMSTPSLSAATKSSSASDPDRARAVEDRRRRKLAAIHVRGDDVPSPLTSFGDLRPLYNTPDYIVANMIVPPPAGLGYTTMTPIQAQSMSAMMTRRDMIACAPTGSGKTIAFAIPMLSMLQEPAALGIRAIIIAPTRELCEQTHRVLERVTSGRHWRMYMLSKANATALLFDKNSTKRKDILITTPMRLLQLIQRFSLFKKDHKTMRRKNNLLSAVNHLILDEADRLIDMGFLPQIELIIAACRAQHDPTPRLDGQTFPLQICFFSATLPQSLLPLTQSILTNNPIQITIGQRNAATHSILQSLVFVGTEAGKLVWLKRYMSTSPQLPLLLFCQSKERCMQLEEQLKSALPAHIGQRVSCMHADQPMTVRHAVLNGVRTGTTWVLITTDLLARGMDLPSITAVINYDFPQSITSYIHRIGRTGRAGRSGTAITLFTDTDRDLLRTIATVMSEAGCPVEPWMLGMKKITPKKAKKLELNAPPRLPIAQRKEKKKKKRRIMSSSTDTQSKSPAT